MSAAPAQFAPFSTFIDPTFWQELARRKLDDWRLDESAKPLRAVFSTSDGLEGVAPRLWLAHDSLDEADAKSNALTYRGRLELANKLEHFQQLDRKTLIDAEGAQIWRTLESNEWLRSPGQSLNRFVLTCYADLKRFDYHFWTCVPALAGARLTWAKRPERSSLDRELEDSIREKMSVTGEPFLAIRQNRVLSLLELFQEGVAAPSEDVAIVFTDPSTSPSSSETPDFGWPARNLVLAVAHTFKWDAVPLIGIRALGWRKAVIGVEWLEPEKRATAVGWERDSSGRLASRRVDLTSIFDPARLMDAAVRLNVGLIKWRLVPDLQVERLANLRVLLLGAGTLGCNIARSLLAWGVKRFAFVDCARVSYSNPARQSLLDFEDAKEGRMKAEAAADAIKRIWPTAETAAHVFAIPMPGHRVPDGQRDETIGAVRKLEQLIINSDVVFLALDSREARWLPALLSTYHKKFAVSVALGFDTWLVLRHGVRDVAAADEEKMDEDGATAAKSGSIPAARLGCYFCSDVTAPGDSQRDRTLDQQCTVTRGGLSAMASGAAVELLAASVAQSEFPEIDALVSQSAGNSRRPRPPLGQAPHQIRYFADRFEQLTPCVARFEKCVACSDRVQHEFRTRGTDFVLELLESPSALERITGLDELRSQADQMAVLEFDDTASMGSAVDDD